MTAIDLSTLGDDDVRAFRRAVAILDELEAAASARINQRVRVVQGVWAIPRPIVEAHFLLKLFGCPAYGVPLDSWIRNEASAALNVALGPVEVARQQPHVGRAADEPELYFDHSAYDAFELRAERNGYASGADDW